MVILSVVTPQNNIVTIVTWPGGIGLNIGRSLGSTACVGGLTQIIPDLNSNIYIDSNKDLRVPRGSVTRQTI